MADGNGGGNGMFFGGLGKPGVRESTQVNILTQITIPSLRFMWIWGLITSCLFAVYILAKVFIWTRGDWSLLIGMLCIALTVFVFVRVVQNPLVRFGGRLVNLQYVIDSALHNWIISAVAIGLLLMALIVFVEWVVPVITYILDQQWYVVLLICATAGLLLSARSLIVHHKRNLENSLFDSSENVYMHSQDKMLDLIRYLDERGELHRFDDLNGRLIASRPMPINGQRIVDMLAKQDLDINRKQEQIEQAPPRIQAPAGIEGYSKRANNGKGGNVFVSNDKVYKFLKAINGSGEKTAARSNWEGANKVDWLSLAERDALYDRLEAVGLLDNNKRLLLPYAKACEVLGIPLPEDERDAVQSGISSAVPSRPASVPSRPILANTGNAALDDAVNSIPGIDR